MNCTDIIVRPAKPADAEEILEIYRPYVEKTAITFEYDVPSPEEFTARITNTLKKYPWIAAEKNGEILGYAYTGPFKERAAYDWAVETTIYIKESCQKTGVGRLLYQALENISRAQNITNLNACIACPETDDEYLTRNSAEFHAHMGYRPAGKFYKCGYKFGRWYNMIWMEKIIGRHMACPPMMIPFPKLSSFDDAVSLSQRRS